MSRTISMPPDVWAQLAPWHPPQEKHYPGGSTATVEVLASWVEVLLAMRAARAMRRTVRILLGLTSTEHAALEAAYALGQGPALHALFHSMQRDYWKRLNAAEQGEP